MPSAEYDLVYLSAGVEQLERFLLSKEIYWPPGVSAPAGEPPYPQLTLGWLLLARRRLQVNEKTPVQQVQFTRLEREMDISHKQWRMAWEKKTHAEALGRLNLWRDFLDEYCRDPEAHFDRYAYEVGRRVLVELLFEEAGEIRPAEREMLSGLDKKLEAIFEEGNFIWGAGLEMGFPQYRYWFLYGKLPRTIHQ